MSAAGAKVHDDAVAQLRELFPRESMRSISLALLQCHDNAEQATKLLLKNPQPPLSADGVATTPATPASAAASTTTSGAGGRAHNAGGCVCFLCQATMATEHLLAV